MALTSGTTIPGTTTLSAFIDMIYANRTNLPAGTEVITALDATRIVVSWPGVGNGDNLIYLTPAARQMIPGATIGV